VSAILHHISLLRMLPKSYFKISTFQPNFLCSSSFNSQMAILFNVVALEILKMHRQYRYNKRILADKNADEQNGNLMNKSWFTSHKIL